jgi:CheY-like chemotaxis protein
MKKVDNLKCILLVDDDNITNFVHQKLIKKTEIDVFVQVVENGKEALDFLMRKGKFANSLSPQPGIIFLDINMPVMDGWEFMDAYEKLESECRIGKMVVMMLTSSLNSEDKAKAELHKGGIAKFISKPINSESIKEAIDTFEKL